MPVILTLSSRVVVPPAESIVKFPAEVSISLSLATPILMLSIVAPPFASRRPVNVDTPATDNEPPTFRFFAIPTPPATVNAPVVVVVDSVVFVVASVPA